MSITKVLNLTKFSSKKVLNLFQNIETSSFILNICQ